MTPCGPFHTCYIDWVQLDIAQIILNLLASLRDPARPDSLPFAMIISHLLVDIGFEIDQTLGTPRLCALIDESLWSKHVSLVTGQGRSGGDRDTCHGTRSSCA